MGGVSEEMARGAPVGARGCRPHESPAPVQACLHLPSRPATQARTQSGTASSPISSELKAQLGRWASHEAALRG